MTSLPRALTPEVEPPAESAHDDALWAPLAGHELHVERLDPFTWRNTVWSAALWPFGAVWILGGFALVWILDKTVLPGPKMYRLPRFLARNALRIAGVGVKSVVHPDIDPAKSYVFVPNHVSMADAPVLSVAAPMNARAFQERRHLEIPIFGALTKLFGEVLIDPKDKALNELAHQEALRRVRAGTSWLVFPEGSRSFDGKLGPFYPGAFRLAIEAQVPVVPVAQRGLRNICPPGEWRGRPGVVEVVYDAPIPTAGMRAEPAQIERLAHRARRAVNRLLAEGAPRQ